MDPERVRDALAARHARKAGQRPFGIPADARMPSEDPLYDSIASSYFTLRMGLAALALAMPIALWIGAGAHHLQHSLSAYYHFSQDRAGTFGAGTMRDWFVGMLWAVGVFLLLYRGYSRVEDRVLDVAGIAAVLIALFPMDWPENTGATRSGHATVHYLAAATFFTAIAYVCVFRAHDTLSILKDPVRVRMFRAAYRLLGTLMVGMPLGIFLASRVAPVAGQGWLFWAEVAGVYAFATFWLVKSREIWEIENIADA